MSDVIDGLFYSSLNQKNVPYRVIVPDRVSHNRPFRVLYLLHGLFGSWENWTDLTNLQRYAADVDFLVVMPDGGDNWYTDRDVKYESYLVQDLLPAIERDFGAGTHRHDRAIAGNSMGGYGAIKLALKNPELFGFAASFSGAFHAARLDARNDGELGPSILRVFGNDAIRNENDLFDVAKRAAAATTQQLPRIYFDCGVDDRFIAVNEEFSSFLSAKGVQHEFLETEGAHDWSYWDKRVRHLLPVLSDHFG